MTYAQAIEKYQKILVAYHYEMDENSKNAIAMYEQSANIDSALELLCDGLISNDEFVALLEIADKTDLCPFFQDYRKEMEETELSEEVRNRLFTFCFNTYNSNFPILPIKFSEALMLNGKAHLTINKSGFLTCDKQLSAVLIELGINLYIIDRGEVHCCSKEDVLDCSDNGVLIPNNYMAAYAVSKVIDGQHFNDFYTFCQQNHISADEKFEEKYLMYVRRIKLVFSIQLYRPFRHICGDTANILDYEKSKEEYTDEISFGDEYADVSADILIETVKNMYLRRCPIKNNDVIEIKNGDKIRHYVYKKADTDKGYTFDEVSGFLTPLFDEAAVMEIINLHHSEIKTDGEKIFIPNDFKEKFADDFQLEVAKNILRQKLQNVNKKESKNQKLKDILAKVQHKKRIPNSPAGN